MKNLLLASATFMFVAATTSFAAPSIENQLFPAANPVQHGFQMLADNDGDGGGDNGGSGGSGGSGGGDDGADHESNDDHGGASNNDDNDDDGDEDADGSSGHGKKHGKKSSNAKKSKPRVPGGRGCDSARDRAEHPECTTG
jgi:hypothetical protein